MYCTIFKLIAAIGWLSMDGFSQSSWELDRDKDGIQVYTRQEQESDFKSFKAVMTLWTTPAQIMNVLREADQYTRWYGFTKASELLNQTDTTQYNYVETIFPWPYSNRDMVYRMSTSLINANIIKVSLRGIPDYIPAREGIVRMQHAEGFMLLEQVDDKTIVTYQFHSEPGDVPSWLANNAIAELPVKTMLGLRNEIKKCCQSSVGTH
ncbi:MAG: hypothetical protein JXQ90_02580 [Cyclobacteriaceae bacterium]